MSLGTPCPPHSGNLLHLFINIPFFSSHTRIPQKAVLTVLLDQVLQPSRGLPQLCRPSDQAAGSQLRQNCQQRISRTGRSRYRWQKKTSSSPATWVVMGTQKGQLWKKNSHATGKRSTSPLDDKKIANVHYASSDVFLKFCIDFFFFPAMTKHQTETAHKGEVCLGHISRVTVPRGRDGTAAEAGRCKVKGACDGWQIGGRFTPGPWQPVNP